MGNLQGTQQNLGARRMIKRLSPILENPVLNLA